MGTYHNTNNVPIIGQNKIVVAVMPSKVAGTFDVEIDTSNFPYGTPFAVQCLLQATMSLVPIAYQAINNAKGLE